MSTEGPDAKPGRIVRQVGGAPKILPRRAVRPENLEPG